MILNESQLDMLDMVPNILYIGSMVITPNACMAKGSCGMYKVYALGNILQH